MPLRTLHIDTNPDHFESLYSKVIFPFLYKKPEYKNLIFLLVFLAPLAIIVSVYYNKEEYLEALGWGAFFCMLFPLMMLMKFNDKIGWNNLVYESEKEFKQYSTYILKYSPRVLAISNDGGEKIFSWKMLRSCYIDDQYIIIEIGLERIIIPVTAIAQNDFDAIAAILIEKTKSIPN